MLLYWWRLDHVYLLIFIHFYLHKSESAINQKMSVIRIRMTNPIQKPNANQFTANKTCFIKSDRNVFLLCKKKLHFQFDYFEWKAIRIISSFEPLDCHFFFANNVMMWYRLTIGCYSMLLMFESTLSSNFLWRSDNIFN